MFKAMAALNTGNSSQAPAARSSLRGQYTSFLIDCLSLAAKHSIDGAIHFVFMDWRHIGELLAAGIGSISETQEMSWSG